MKFVAGFGVLLFLAAIGYYFAIASGGDGPTVEIPLVFGNLKDGSMDVHGIVGVVLAAKSRKREPMEKGKPLEWNDWVRTHCILKSTSGEQVPVGRATTSNLVRTPEVQAMVGTEEFFLMAKVKPGQAYTFDYIIEMPDPLTFRCQFTAPQGAAKVQRFQFTPVP